MRYLSLFLLSAVLSISSAQAQQFNPSFLFGLGADALMSLSTPVANGESTIGSGRQFYAWSAYQWSETQRLQFSLGYRVMGGYQWQQLSGETVFTPIQVQEFLYLEELIALNYLDAELGWRAHWKQHPRWSVQIGIRLARLASIQGREEGHVRVTGLNINNEENQTGISNRFVAEPLYKRELDRSAYPNWDFGASLNLYYQLVEGLNIRMGSYAGFQQVLGGRSNHRVRTLSIGLETRIF
ncbi:MAG: hypothetical protein GVY26_12365 [Bacteroidetes bacterium]|jgi:hypothetical protein|nr:hypothetical protein [Bacteroidota bacterium]